MNQEDTGIKTKRTAKERVKIPFVIAWLVLNAVILVFNYGAHKKITPEKEKIKSDKSDKNENDQDRNE